MINNILKQQLEQPRQADHTQNIIGLQKWTFFDTITLIMTEFVLNDETKSRLCFKINQLFFRKLILLNLFSMLYGRGR
jgi:hypothetical protein